MKVCKGCGGTLDHLSPYEQRYHRYRCNNVNYSIISFGRRSAGQPAGSDLATLVAFAVIMTPIIMLYTGWSFFTVAGLLAVFTIGIAMLSKHENAQKP